MKFLALLIVSFALLFSSCGVFVSPREKPVIKDTIGLSLFAQDETNVFSLTPERRTVIVVKSDPESLKVMGLETTPPLRFCAEPPPDIAEGIASSVSALAKASLESKQSDVSGRAQLELSRALTTSIEKLFYRSQGTQLFRDGSFALCQAYLNGMIDVDEYKNKYEDLLNKSFMLIMQELPAADTEMAKEAARRAEKAKEDINASMAKATAAKAASEAAAKRAENALAEIRMRGNDEE